MQAMARPGFKNISKAPSLILISSVIIISAIAGLIMDASGVPWFSEGENYNSDTNKYDNYESQDWDECCEETHQEISEADEFGTVGKIFSPLTSYFILILIFSILCLAATLIPMPSFVKLPLVVLMGLATTVSGIFLLRKFVITLGFYFSSLADLGPNDSPSMHLHVMVYFGGFVGILCLILGYLVFGSLKRGLQLFSSKKVLSGAVSFLNISLLVFLISPLLPLTYASVDTDYEYYDKDEDADGTYIFGYTALMYSDMLSSSEYNSADSSETEIFDSTFGNYALVENLFFAMIWINLSVIMLVALSVIPKVGFVFEGIAQINILSLVLIILALIFTIILYVNIPDLLSDEGIYSEERYSSLYFHLNWIMPIACLLGILNWVLVLIRSHIPWWISMTSSKQSVTNNSFSQHTAISGVVQQNSQSYEQQLQNPPRF